MVGCGKNIFNMVCFFLAISQAEYYQLSLNKMGSHFL